MAIIIVPPPPVPNEAPWEYIFGVLLGGALFLIVLLFFTLLGYYLDAKKKGLIRNINHNITRKE
jgi:hypothetical protein